MIIDSINLNHIRIFECVHRTKSMTKAAEELHMTQSGVSQHIKLLEDILEVKLFDRIKQRLIPTSNADELFQRCSKGLYDIEQALIDIKGGQKIFSGEVSLGLPVEFGNNIIIPLLAKFGREHDRVNFKITYAFASEIEHLLLTGVLDLAFVDSINLDRQIKTTNVYDETLCLCASPEYLNGRQSQKESKKFFESLAYIEYVKEQPLLHMWFKHHFDILNIKLNVRSTMMDVQGVARMIVEGLGIGILPHHHIHKLEALNKEIYQFKGKGEPLKNPIGLAYVEGRTRTPTINALVEFLIQSLHDKTNHSKQ